MNRFPLSLSCASLGLALLASGAPVAAQSAATGVSEPGHESTAEAPEVLTAVEAAKLLQVSDAVLIDLAGTGRLPARMVGTEWRFSRAALMRWLTGDHVQFAGDRAPVSAPPMTVLSSRESAALVGRGTTFSAAQDTPPTEPNQTIGAAPGGRTASEVFLRDQRILLATNEVALDFGVSYGRSDDLVLTEVGEFVDLGVVDSDSFGASLVGRYSIGRDTELFASTSYRKQNVSLFADGLRVDSASRGRFGDLQIGARRTVLHEGPGRPDVILTAVGSVPTGRGTYSLGGGVALVKSFDPAVLFGSIDYRHSFSRDFADMTRLQPRDQIDAVLGYAFALNDTLILNTGVSGSFSLASAFSEARLRQTDTYNLLMGMTARLSRRLFVQPSVTYSLNGPGNAVIFGLNFPYSFGL